MPVIGDTDDQMIGWLTHQSVLRADRHERLALRTRLRDDRRATQPRSTDDLESPSNWAGVAITARTQDRST
jgi:hypothetical protein